MCVLSHSVVSNSATPDCSPPVSFIHGIFQARILECVAISFSRGIFAIQGSNPCLSYRQVDFYHFATWVYVLPLIRTLRFYLSWLFESWFLKNSVRECFWHCFIHFLYYYSIRLICVIWFCLLSSFCLFFACLLAFLHSFYFLPSTGNSFNWVF